MSSTTQPLVMLSARLIPGATLTFSMYAPDSMWSAPPVARKRRSLDMRGQFVTRNQPFTGALLLIGFAWTLIAQMPTFHDPALRHRECRRCECSVVSVHASD
jgi:hypothetical protein